MRILPTSKLIGCAETYHKGRIAYANTVERRLLPANGSWYRLFCIMNKL